MGNPNVVEENNNYGLPDGWEPVPVAETALPSVRGGAAPPSQGISQYINAAIASTIQHDFTFSQTKYGSPLLPQHPLIPPVGAGVSTTVAAVKSGVTIVQEGGGGVGTALTLNMPASTFLVAGSPGSNISVSFLSQPSNTFFAAPTGAGIPTWRTFVVQDFNSGTNASFNPTGSPIGGPVGTYWAGNLSWQNPLGNFYINGSELYAAGPDPTLLVFNSADTLKAIGFIISNTGTGLTVSNSALGYQAVITPGQVAVDQSQSGGTQLGAQAYQLRRATDNSSLNSNSPIIASIIRPENATYYSNIPVGGSDTYGNLLHSIRFESANQYTVNGAINFLCDGGGTGSNPAAFTWQARGIANLYNASAPLVMTLANPNFSLAFNTIADGLGLSPSIPTRPYQITATYTIRSQSAQAHVVTAAATNIYDGTAGAPYTTMTFGAHIGAYIRLCWIFDDQNLGYWYVDTNQGVVLS